MPKPFKNRKGGDLFAAFFYFGLINKREHFR